MTQSPDSETLAQKLKRLKDIFMKTLEGTSPDFYPFMVPVSPEEEQAILDRYDDDEDYDDRDWWWQGE